MKYMAMSFFAMCILSCGQAQGQLIEGCALSGFVNDTDVDCGFLEVPENRNNPKSRKIKLAYLVLKAKSNNPKPDPIVYLQGGPGGQTLSMANFWSRNQLLDDRDFILVDQRGTGFSGAVCPELGLQLMDVVGQDLTAEQEFQKLWEAGRSCKTEMDEMGLDQAGYNSRENAADLDDLREALGYEQWNLFGGSYGSRLALTYMRDFPQNVRTSIMTGMFPPEVDLHRGFMSNLKRSLEMTFEACANDKECKSEYPELRKHYFEMLRSLDEAPFTFDYRGKPFTINPQDMLLLTQQMLYSRSTIGRIPAFTMAIKDKNVGAIKASIQSLEARAKGINFAMNWSVQAYEELPFNLDDPIKEDLKRFPEYQPGPAFFLSDIRILEKWHSFRAGPIEDRPVKSDIPSFVVNGSFDPITPPSNARAALENLSNAHYVELENEGHSTFSACLFGMIDEFLENPLKKPNTGCVARAPGIPWR